MIKTVVKRNGEVVAFDPSKLSKWAEWASGVGVDWFMIVGEAYKKCQDNVSTQELHRALISSCVDQETTPYLLMAGRLMVGEVYKDVFGGTDKIPSLSSFYKQMVQEGFWEDMDYNDEELEYLNTVIDHKADFNLTSTQVLQDKQKYLLADITTGKLKETFQFALMRQAMGAHKSQPKDRRLNDVVGMYQDLKRNWVNTPTPNKTNLGTEKRSYASCCASLAIDELDSIEAQNHIIWRMTAASAGQGSLLMTRSAGDGVRNGTISHGGKIPYFRLQEAEAKANKQNTRGGSVTTHILALDPELEDLLKLRNPTTVASKKVDGIDYSFTFNESFYRRAAERKPWLLVSMQKAPDLYEHFFDEDMEVFDKLMDEYIEKGMGVVIPDAATVLAWHLVQDEVVGRQYETNVTAMNRHKPFKDTIYQSNLCVTPETKILTKEGYKEIGGLEGLQVDVWNGEQWSNVLVEKTGNNQEIIRVVTKDGYELECTPYHKFYKIEKDKWNKPKEVEVRAIDLKKGDKLVKFKLPVIEGDKVLDRAWINGFYSGDGCEVKGKEYVYFYHDKRKLVDLVKETATTHYVDEKQNRELLIFNGLEKKYFVPDCSYTIESRLEWLAGLLDSDGTLCFNGKTQSFQIGSVDPSFLKEVQLMLQTCGVGSKVTKNQDGGMKPLPANDGTGEYKLFMYQASYRLLIGNDGVSKLQDLGLRTRRLKPTSHRPNRECSQFIKIEGVYSDGRVSDTYCFNEPLRHRGMFNGMLTGQCQELAEPTKPYKNVSSLYHFSPEDEQNGEVAMCNLAAIPVGKVSLRQSDYEELAYRTLLMVDNTIDIAEIPLPHVDYTAKQRRSVMIGITDLAHAMASQGLSYSSIEGKNFIHRVAELHMYSLIKASVRLAKEKGVCGWYHKTRYSEGWLPIDTYNKNVDNVHTQKLLCDWEGLRAEVKKYGMRNSALVGHMPCESSSVRGNDTNGLYPVRDGVMVKKSGNTKVVFIAPEWENLKPWYDIAWNVPHNDLVDCYAIVQKFTDQAISADIYHKFEEGKEKKVSMTQLMEEFFYRQKMGMKTRYYKNFSVGASQIEQEESCSGGSCKL